MARPTRRPGNLPAESTSFIGRRRELAALRKTLAEARLVTLVGPGGVGKTRLAIRSGTDLARAFPDGAWLVELADIRDPGVVIDAVLGALDLRDQTATGPRPVLLSYLREKELLLLVDNCEHLLDAAAQLATDVLRAAPGLKVIATSREPLSVPGEHVLPVPPLDLPRGPLDEPLEQLRLNEAVGLFVERASAASGGFELTADNRAAVVEVCRRLDGLPLAIELAAVRTRVLSPEQIRDRLADRFRLLTGGSRALPRHQTLQTAIEWSYDLLATDERALLRDLSVFAGRATLDDISAVCDAGDRPSRDILDLVSSLVDKSLVAKEDAPGEACYRLHETMREFARLRLAASGEAAIVAERFVEHYLSTCRRGSDAARSDLVAWLDWMDLEIDNIRSVLRRSLELGEIGRGMGLATSLRWYWATRATAEGVRWLDELLAIGSDDAELQAQALYLRGFLAVLLVDPVGATPALERAAALDRDAGRLGALRSSLSMASVAANMAGDRSAARRLLDEAETVTAGPDDIAATLALLQARALEGLFAGDVQAAIEASSDGARLSRRIGDLYTLKVWLLNLGTAALIAGDLDAARQQLEEALQIAHQVDDRVQEAYLLDAAGCLAAESGEPQLAAQLLGAAETMRTGAGARVMPFLAPLVGRAEATAVAALGRPRFEAAHGTGGRLSRDAAAQLALGRGSALVARPERGTGPLSKREEEVARLVAEGLTNKEIGARLFISEHTVDSHIRGILNKLGFDSRARIAAWIVASNEQ
jgi:predicted ATPase/DNA-binding CsgD family transcriptional regulator